MQQNRKVHTNATGSLLRVATMLNFFTYEFSLRASAYAFRVGMGIFCREKVKQWSAALLGAGRAERWGSNSLTTWCNLMSSMSLTKELNGQRVPLCPRWLRFGENVLVNRLRKSSLNISGSTCSFLFVHAETEGAGKHQGKGAGECCSESSGLWVCATGNVYDLLCDSGGVCPSLSLFS